LAPVEEVIGLAAAVPGRARNVRGPVVIEARGVEKTFRIPDHRIDSFRERATHPFTRVEYREHRALRGVSFDVRQGEFFAIVGRNGSGKSSLLKILASIYRADAGTVRTAGRVAPFIELGVGFNPEMTARENAVLNGVLMGMTLREARRSLDAVLEFAELEDFVDLRLKNYSSGMLVRFAFAVMVQADADIMLIDEVLAVGDAAFAQKCMDVFREKQRAGKTIVLVTHDMTTVQTLCHRAMLIDDGELRYIGEPEDTALHYYRVNFAGRSRSRARRSSTSTRASRGRGWRAARRRWRRGSRSSLTSRSRLRASSTGRASSSTCATPTGRRCSSSSGGSTGGSPRAGGCCSRGRSRTGSCPASTRSTSTCARTARRAG
jgi:ABC-type polysaccharide/polyol phosphate transport system ATPase subunit